MTIQEVVTVPRTSWRYRVLIWFYKKEERFPKTTCGIRARLFVLPIGYLASCLFLFTWGVALILIGIGQSTLGVVAPWSFILSFGLGVLNLLFLTATLVWPRFWFYCTAISISGTVVTLGIALGMMKSGLLVPLPTRFQFIIWGTVVGLLVAAQLASNWWFPMFLRLYTRVCKPVKYT